MAQILVRGLDAKTVDRLKARARQNGRSLQSEVKLILEGAAESSREATLVALHKFRRGLGRRFGESAEMIREDRGR